MTYLGIDIGTSGVKVAVCDDKGALIDTASASLTVQQPQPLWSEQDPQSWWHAVCDCLDQLHTKGLTRQVESIGLSGQMHGAVLLDEQHAVIRPAILWNDGRSATECEELTALVPDAHDITGNLIMPGFTAPKLRWVAKHDPKLFAKVDKVLLTERLHPLYAQWRFRQ